VNPLQTASSQLHEKMKLTLHFNQAISKTSLTMSDEDIEMGTDVPITSTSIMVVSQTNTEHVTDFKSQ
jgi:hypothetical protein